MKDGQILQRSESGPVISQAFLNDEFRGFYSGLKAAWQVARLKLGNNQLGAVIIDHATDVESLSLKPGFRVQLPGESESPEHKSMANNWQPNFYALFAEAESLTASARILAVHQEHLTDGSTPRHKQIGEVNILFTPTSPLSYEDRLAIQKLGVSIEPFVLSDAAYETVYTPENVRIGLNYYPFDLIRSGRRSPLVNFTVYPNARVSANYYFDGIEKGSNRKDPSIKLTSFETSDIHYRLRAFRGGAEMYFPGVQVTPTP